jgi:hypothetical protein
LPNKETKAFELIVELPLFVMIGRVEGFGAIGALGALGLPDPEVNVPELAAIAGFG